MITINNVQIEEEKWYPTEFYFSRDIVDQVVKDCGEDYKIYLGIK